MTRPSRDICRSIGAGDMCVCVCEREIERESVCARAVHSNMRLLIKMCQKILASKVLLLSYPRRPVTKRRIRTGACRLDQYGGRLKVGDGQGVPGKARRQTKKGDRHDGGMREQDWLTTPATEMASVYNSINHRRRAASVMYEESASFLDGRSLARSNCCIV